MLTSTVNLTADTILRVVLPFINSIIKLNCIYSLVLFVLYCKCNSVDYVNKLLTC